MAERDDPSQLETKPLPGDMLAQIKKARSQGPKYSIILYHRAGSQIVPLVPGTSLVIGREAPSDVIVADESLSRMHARFSVEGEEVIVEDLKSTNGTSVDGEPITEKRIKPGDEIALGAVTASLFVSASSEAKGLGLASHERLFTLLEEDVIRAKHFGRRFALLMVRAAREKDGHQSRWYERVRALLRPVDRAALYAPGQVEILIPECGREEADKTARAIIEGRAAGEPVLFCGVAIYPDSGVTADALLEAAHDVCYRATPKNPIEAAGTASEPTPRTAVAPAIVKSASMKQIYETIDRLSRTAIPVLIFGETGTGKEVVARAIHEHGPRKNLPICAVNCGAIPSQLVESTLFGHEKGAFTGAVSDQKGIFEAAGGGTVFLDEIGELPASAQAALLRVLETKRITRVGSTKEREVDVRVVAATHRDLEAMSAAGTFRSDLYYRLNVMSLVLPPLRERKEEIAPLADSFVAAANLANGTQVRGIDEEALELLLAYKWPGNVRELKNAIDRAVVIARGDQITVADLPERVRVVVQAAPEVSAGDEDYKARVQQAESAILLDALKKTNGNQTEAAKALGMPLRTFVHKMKVLGIKKAGYTT